MRKKHRKINKKPMKSTLPKPLAQVNIVLMSDGKVNVSGFPNNLTASLEVMEKGKIAVIKWFFGKAKENRLDWETLTVDDTKIQVVPKMPGLQ